MYPALEVGVGNLQGGFAAKEAHVDGNVHAAFLHPNYIYVHASIAFVHVAACAVDACVGQDVAVHKGKAHGIVLAERNLAIGILADGDILKNNVAKGEPFSKAEVVECELHGVVALSLDDDALPFHGHSIIVGDFILNGDEKLSVVKACGFFCHILRVASEGAEQKCDDK